MKKIIGLLLIVLLSAPAQAVETDNKGQTEMINPGQIIQEQLKQLDLSELKQQVDNLNRETGDYLPDLTIKDLMRLFSKQGLQTKFKRIGKGLARYLFDELLVNSKLLGKLIILSIIAAILKNLQANFASRQVSKLANVLVYLVLIIIALDSFKLAVNIGREAVGNMVDVMQAILPVLLSLLVSMGNLTSASLFHPLTFLIVNALSTVVKNIIFPLIFLATILDIVNNITDEFEVTGLASLIKQGAMAGLGVITTVFGAAILTQGTVATVSDGVTIRTAKYLTGSFIPVVGGFVSNALDLVVGGSLLIKNALGVFSVIIILLFCSFSVLKIVALVVIYRLAGAVIQPIDDSKIVSCLNKLGTNLLLVFGAVTVVGIMFFVVVLIMVGTANFTVMMR